MYIANCQIKSYKSFRNSDTVNFDKGFNVVVGQNNAGKSAFLEALSLRFENNPHRSIATDQIMGSSISFSVGVDAQEAFAFFRQFGPFALRHRPGLSNQAAMLLFEKHMLTGVRIAGTSNGTQIANQQIIGFTEVDAPATFFVEASAEAPNLVLSNNSRANQLIYLAAQILIQTQSRLYRFDAERLNIEESPISIEPILLPDARNLPGVLHLLQSKNKTRFMRFVRDVQTVFPDIRDITIVPVSINSVKISIWFVEPESEREDLAIALTDCGTGIGQVLAILYVVITSDFPRVILIDEPQSFLHPGAIQKLFTILKREEHRKHQFIVTTHSPTVVTAASPCNVILLRRRENESKAETIDINETNELRLFLSEVGARLSDVFGADRILWVEGRTEELCFRLIIKDILGLELLGTEIIGVTHVGDLEGRQKEVTIEIYKKLCKGKGLLPPAMGFCFDQEGRSAEEQKEMSEMSSGLVKFIPSRMYENFLLNPEAIAAVLSESDKNREKPLAVSDVSDWLNQNRLATRYIQAGDSAQWLQRVDSAKLLKDLFNALSDTRVAYDKVKHGVSLTTWIIRNARKDFDDLVNFLKEMLKT